MKFDRPAPLPVRETRYGFFYVETADVYSDGRRENVKRTPYWKLFDDDEDEDERQAETRSSCERSYETGSAYQRSYKVNHKPM